MEESLHFKIKIISKHIIQITPSNGHTCFDVDIFGNECFSLAHGHAFCANFCCKPSKYSKYSSVIEVKYRIYISN